MSHCATPEAPPEYWMQRLKAGHEEALAHLMSRFERPVFAFLYRRLQGETGVVQELTQEVFLKCLQHCHRFEDGRPVAAWLFTLAANAATDHLRKRGRELPPPESFDAPDPHQISPWDLVDKSRKLRALQEALEGLTPRQRTMILAYYVQERPVKEIAGDLGCAEGTVKATLFQSLAKLESTWKCPMKSAPEMPPYNEQDLFELLNRPENWPEDPTLQSQLADCLELHLALRAHGPELQGILQVAPRFRVFQNAWMMAAATLLALVPGVFAVQHTRHLRALARDRARIEEVAQRRGQDRLWAAFFQQSSNLITKFENTPLLCGKDRKDREDRNPERELAATLLQASHQLAAQNAPNSEAEIARTNLHAWLTELSMEDGCMEPDRAAELRQWAATHNLEDESKRLGRLLKGEIE